MALSNVGDVRNDILVKLNQSTTVGFYTDAILSRWIDMANGWAASYYKWPMTEGRYSTTSASLTTGEDGFTMLEYPEGFKSDSIRLLTIGGKQFYKKNFYKFRQFMEDNTGDSSKIYSDFARRVYINSSASGLSGSVVAWGQVNVATLPYDTANSILDANGSTIFTGSEEDGNEALVEEVLSYAMQREKSPVTMVKGKTVSAAGMHHQNAITILDKIYNRIQAEQFGYLDTLNEGMYKRFDVLRGGFKEDIFKRDQWFS